MDFTLIREQLRRGGYAPLPLQGKHPPMKGWSQKIDVSFDEIKLWPKLYPFASNTGVLTATTPAIDIDILSPEAAAAIEQLARVRFEEHGHFMVRIGRAPRRSLLFRTNAAFKKFVVQLIAANESKHEGQQIEVLGDGQQVVVAGIHPDIRQPYHWHGGTPWEVPAAELPLITEQEAHAFVDDAVELLVAEHGYKRARPKIEDDGKASQPAPTANVQPATDRHARFAEVALNGVAGDLAATAPGGRNDALNKAAFRMATMIARGWIDRPTAEGALLAAAASLVKDDGEHAARATIKSGIEAGLKQPHADLEDRDPPKFKLKEVGIPHPGCRQTVWRDNVFTASELRAMRFKVIEYVVPGIIPEGLTILAGKPKIGKSWLALDLALAIPGGRYVLGDLKPAPGDVLYCALEDNKRRLWKRTHKIMAAADIEWPKGLILSTQWRRLDAGGIEDIIEWARSVPNARLVILDTLAGVRPERSNRDTQYEGDYRALRDLHDWSNETGIAVLLLTHTRKMEADDPIDTISGTLGLAGCADTSAILARSSKGTTLYIRGRDVEEQEHAVKFDPETCRWTILGDAGEIQQTYTRRKLSAALQEATGPMSPADLIAATGLSKQNVDTTLHRMVKEGKIVRISRGFYAAAKRPTD